MTDEMQPGDVLRRIEALEYHAWKCFEEADTNRERLAALKTISDLVLTQLRLSGQNNPKEEVESVDYYYEQLQKLGERVRQLALRRGKARQEQGS